MANTLRPSQRFRILERDGFACQYCGRGARETTLEVDHVHPRSLGGSNRPENLLTSCRDCNQGKSDRQLSEPAQDSPAIPWLVGSIVVYATIRPASLEALTNICLEELPVSDFGRRLRRLLWALRLDSSLVPFGIHYEDRL